MADDPYQSSRQGVGGGGSGSGRIGAAYDGDSGGSGRESGQRATYWGSEGKQIFRRLSATHTKSTVRALEEQQHRQRERAQSATTVNRLQFAPMVSAGGALRQMPTYDDPSTWPSPAHYDAYKDILDARDQVSPRPATAKFTQGPRELDFGSPTFVRDMKMAMAELVERAEYESKLAKLDVSTSPRLRASRRPISAPTYKKELVTPKFTLAERFSPKDPYSFLHVSTGMKSGASGYQRSGTSTSQMRLRESMGGRAVARACVIQDRDACFLPSACGFAVARHIGTRGAQR
jgi:hypothetical protein